MPSRQKWPGTQQLLNKLGLVLIAIRETHTQKSYITGGMSVIRKDLLYSIWPYIRLFRAGFKEARLCLELAPVRKWR